MKLLSRYQIEVPEELRHVLANDWDLVVHQKYLFKVPAKVKDDKTTSTEEYVSKFTLNLLFR